MNRLFAAIIGVLTLISRGLGRSQLPHYQRNPQIRGSVECVEHLGSYPGFVIRALFWLAKFDVRVSNGIDLYRITYWSQTNGEPVLVSGLMSLPSNGPVRGTVLWMHGTNTDRNASISKPSLDEGVAMSGVFAGGGYLLLAPDLLGLGVSKLPQAYFYNSSTIDVTLDFVRAAHAVFEDLGQLWSPALFIAGFSQGGHSAAVMAREFERLADPKWRLTAAAGIAGPYNLADVSIPLAMTGPSSQDSAYLTNLALAYSTYYGQPLESLLTRVSADRARALFDGDHADQIEDQMPANPREMFTPEFLRAFDHKEPNWFMDALRANEAYRWAPKAPFRAYYGDKDVDVSPDDSKMFVLEAHRRGGNAVSISVGPYDHTNLVFQAVPKVRIWFDTLRVPARP